nr:MAG TPA: hypothetical protein [Caudoviricetes sp.]
MGLAPRIKKRVSDIDVQSEDNIAKEVLDDTDSSFFSTSDEEEGITAKKSKK